MARIQEVRHEGEPWLLYLIGNLTAIDSNWVTSFGIAWLFKENGKWAFLPRLTGNTSLFYNAVFFIRYTITPIWCVPCSVLAYCGYAHWSMFLVGLFFSIRWSPSTTAKALFQGGLGWKLNGRLAILFRIQSDATSASGVTGPNLGQATGFNFGTH